MTKTGRVQKFLGALGLGCSLAAAARAQPMLVPARLERVLIASATVSGGNLRLSFSVSHAARPTAPQDHSVLYVPRFSDPPPASIAKKTEWPEQTLRDAPAATPPLPAWKKMSRALLRRWRKYWYPVKPEENL